MSYLFCESDGEDALQRAIQTRDKNSGEFTKIVIGPLSQGGSRCDRCNRPLEIGETGYYVAHLSESIRDLKGEKQFFDMKNVKYLRY
jgi:hypothetical protein